MAKADYYELLGIAKGASAADIKKAYRKMAMQYHPDKNAGNKASEDKFKEISEAYDVLRDDDRRAAYDRFGHAAFEQGGMGGQGGGAGFGGFDFAGGFGDIFEEMFGEMMGGGRGRGEQSTGTRGSDLRYDLTISLEEAFEGTEKTINVASMTTCETCKGQGTAEGSKPETCSTCGGHGRVRAQQGFFTVERTCPTCQGNGQIIKNPCPDCYGSGRVRRERTLAVKIPAGVETGTRIRLSGEGEAGQRGGHPGDLYVILTVNKHPLFQREGANLYCRVPIPMTLAALGGEIDVPLIDNAVAKMKIEEGTQSGHQKRLRSKGMTVLHSTTRGDLYVELMVETPMKMTKRQKELMEELKGEMDKEDATPIHEKFFRKIKDALS